MSSQSSVIRSPWCGTGEGRRLLRSYRSEIAQYLVGSRDVREEDPVAQPVERHPQRGEALSGGAVNGGDAEVLGEPVLRGEPKALSTQLVVVGQIGPPFAGASSGDVVRKQPREPEAVVAEMRAQQEGPFPGVVEPHEVFHHVDQIVVSLVVAAADADVPVVIAELEQQGGQVVGQRDRKSVV